MLTHFAIRYVQEHEENEDFEITFNAKDHGNLDDIVIREKDMLTLIQLKHKHDKSSNIKIEYGKYKNTYNNIILPKYEQQIEQGLGITIIAYTNAIVSCPNFLKKIPSTNSRLNKFSSGKGEIFQLECNQTVNETSNFFENLYIFSEQESVSGGTNMLLDNFKGKLYKEQILTIFDYFDRSVIERTEPFTKHEIISILNECILKPAMIISNSTYKFLLNDSIINLFENVWKNNNLLIINKNYEQLFVSLINSCRMINPKCNYKELIPQSHLDILFNDTDIKQYLLRKKPPLTYEDLLIVLWQTKNSPIVVDYREFKEQIDYSINNSMNRNDEGPLIIVVDEYPEVLPKNAVIFNNLCLFENINVEIQKQFLENTKIKMGNDERTLKYVIGEEETAIKKITPKILLSLLNNSLKINNSTEEAALYLPRKLNVNLLTKSLFATRNFLFVIHDDDTKMDLEMFLTDQTNYSDVVVVNSKWSTRETKEKANSIERNFCCLRKIEDNYAIYAHKGPIQHFERYLKETKLNEDEVLKNIDLVNVISADAGMGKTYLIGQFEWKLFEIGKLPIYFNLSLTYKEINRLKRNRKTFINYLANKLASNNKNEGSIIFFETVLEHHIKEKNVVLLLDGFDEANLDYKIIDYFLSLNLEVVIATRTHKLPALLQNCECLNFSLLSFTQEDQREFFKLSYTSEEDEKILEMIEVLKNNIQESLMGIPLQIKHVVDIFPNINDFLEVKDEINILFLYETFLTNHLNQSSEGNKLLIQKLACTFLLDSNLLKYLPTIDEDELNDTILDLQNNNKKNFIVTGFDNNIPIFVHRTYAEFLCAKYLAQRRKLSPEIFEELLKQEDLLKVKYFFDVILCRNLKLPFALLMKNSKKIESCLNNQENLQEQDKFGRTALHIVSSYGHYHTQIYKKDLQDNALTLHVNRYYTEFTICEKILHQLLNTIQTNNIQYSIDSWKNSPSDYASKSRSFDFLEQLILYWPGCFSCEDEKSATELIFIDAVCDYPNIFNILYNYENFKKLITNNHDFDNLVAQHLKLDVGNVKKYSYVNTCARNGSVNMVKTLLKKDLFKINERYNSGESKLTVLETAVMKWNVFDKNQKKYLLLISMLIRHNAIDISQKEHEENILHKLAHKIGHDTNNIVISDIPKFLDSHDQSYINSKDSNGKTPLIISIQDAHSRASTEFISLLLQFQANPKFLDWNQRNIWHYLSLNCNLHDDDKLNVATVLTVCFGDEQNGIDDEDKKGVTPLMIAIQNSRNDSLIKYMIAQGANIYKRNKKRENIWQYIGFNKKLNDMGIKCVASMLLSYFNGDEQNGIDEESDNGRRPLTNAIVHATNDSIYLIKFLIVHGADVHKRNKKGSNTWHYLGFNRNLKDRGMKALLPMLMSYFKEDQLNELDIENHNGKTPLIIAVEEAKNDSIYLIQFFIECGVNIYKKYKNGLCIWHYLSLNNYLSASFKIKVASMLLSYFDIHEQTGIDEECDKGHTPLMFAIKTARNDSANFIKYYIEHGANIYHRDKMGSNIWHCFGLNNNLNDQGLKNITSVLMSYFGDNHQSKIDEENENGKTPLLNAISKVTNNNLVHLLKYLIGQGANIHKKTKIGQNIWHYLALNNCINNECIKIVVSVLMSNIGDNEPNGIGDENFQGVTPLMIAVRNARNDSVYLIQYFLEHGANIYKKNNQRENIWHYLMKNYNDITNVDSLFNLLFGKNEQTGINDEDENGVTPLISAIVKAKNSVYKIKYLIERGADIYKKNSIGRNIWHYLSTNHKESEECKIKIAEILISYSNDDQANGIDEEDENGETPLMVAIHNVRNRNVHLFQYLIEHGANIHKKNKIGRNCWHYFTSNTSLNEKTLKIVTPILMSYFHDEQNGINEQDNDGKTPLMLIVEMSRNNSLYLFQYLIKHGANIDKKDTDGRTVRDYLNSNKHLNNKNRKYIENILNEECHHTK